MTRYPHLDPDPALGLTERPKALHQFGFRLLGHCLIQKSAPLTEV
jgi:hypothetical protein